MLTNKELFKIEGEGKKEKVVVDEKKMKTKEQMAGIVHQLSFI